MLSCGAVEAGMSKTMSSTPGLGIAIGAGDRLLASVPGPESPVLATTKVVKLGLLCW